MVKKYGNRRLYDTRESRYVNLDELFDLLGTDKDLRVVDAHSGADLTEQTLRSALLGERGGSAKSPLVPPELLRALIRYRRGAARSDFHRHIVQAVAAFAAGRKPDARN